RFLQARTAGILQRRGVPDQLTRRFDAGGHVGEPETDGLVLEDRLAERDAFLRVAQRRLERRARHAHRLRRDADAAALEPGQRDAVALALFADQVLRRHAAVLEHDLRGVGSVLAGLFLEAGDDVAG